jgi:hypothetical protein
MQPINTAARSIAVALLPSQPSETKQIQATCVAFEHSRMGEQIDTIYFVLLSHLRHLAETATCLKMQQTIPVSPIIAAEGAYTAPRPLLRLSSC